MKNGLRAGVPCSPLGGRLPQGRVSGPCWTPPTALGREMLWDRLRSLLSGAPGMGQGCGPAVAQVKDSLQHAQLSAAASGPLWSALTLRPQQNSIPPRTSGTERCHQLSSGQHFQEPDASRTQASSPSGDLRPPASSLCFLPRASSSPQLPRVPNANCGQFSVLLSA